MFSSIDIVSLLCLGIIGSSVGSTPTVAPAPAPAYLAEGTTNSPVEFSNITIFDDGNTHVVNDEASSFLHEAIVVKDSTILRVEAGGYIEAPQNGYKSDTDWPALRLSIGSILNATGGSIAGSRATEEDTHGGEAVEMYNGQYSPETASYAYFYDGITVIGGDSSDGVGGNALHVHGFGTEAFIYGGALKGGKGSKNGDDGLSIYALNGGEVHIHSGSFSGGMEVGDSSVITFYGCFLRNGTAVTGVFADETNLEVNVRMRNGGEVMFIPDSEQECETAPSTSPTNFPTLSAQPTVPRPKNGVDKNGVSYLCGLIFLVGIYRSLLC
ncbi:hypothetical protein ACHAXR_000795 [Thalassiosira sp. AJA248-18]